jgi:hypothetical protein
MSSSSVARANHRRVRAELFVSDDRPGAPFFHLSSAPASISAGRQVDLIPSPSSSPARSPACSSQTGRDLSLISHAQVMLTYGTLNLGISAKNDFPAFVRHCHATRVLSFAT